MVETSSKNDNQVEKSQKTKHGQHKTHQKLDAPER